MSRRLPNHPTFRSSSYGLLSSSVLRPSVFVSFLAALDLVSAAQVQTVFPGEHWEFRQPASLGLSKAKLDALREVVGGRGCVVRYCYMAYSWGDPAKSADVASAVKPVISTLLLFAVQESRIAGVDSAVSEFEPRLKMLIMARTVPLPGGISPLKLPAMDWRNDPVRLMPTMTSPWPCITTR